MTILNALHTILDSETQAAWTALDSLILRINEHLEASINSIIHHPRFRELETNWLGLAMLADQVDDSPFVKVEFLNVSKEDLREDLEENFHLLDSGLFYHLYTSEYDQAGGTPIGAMIMSYEFDKTSADIGLLKKIAQVASTCHCPAIGNVPLNFFGVKTPREFEDIHDYDLLFTDPVYIKWKALRAIEDSRYLGMVLPQFLIREPYEFRMFDRFAFNEDQTRAEDLPWCGGAIAFAILMARSFIRYGWSLQIRGPYTGGIVEPLEGISLGVPGFEAYDSPLRMSFSDDQEHRLAQQGFIVFNYFPSEGRVCLFSAPTIQAISSPENLTSQDRLAASLPYVFLICRIAHYQKVIQRENIGTVKEEAVLQRELQAWINQYVTEMQEPDADLRRQRPLNGGKVKVKPDPANPGFFNIELVIQPHLQIEGVNAELTLLTRMPRGEE